MLRRELRPMLALAGPVVLAELGWMAMGLVDTMMVGRLGPEAIGAVGIGSSIYFVLAIFGIGLLLGLDTLVSHAFGAGRLEDCHRSLLHGVALAAALTVPMTLILLGGSRTLHLWGFDEEVLRLTVPYLEIITLSTLPLLLYASFRRYLQAMGIVLPVMFALVSANVVNVVTNWMLVFGNLGAPALGVSGAGWATLLSRSYMALVLAAAIVYHNRRLPIRLWRIGWRLEAVRMMALLRLGFPAALQVTLEVGVFAAATVLAGQLDPASLASHQIALNIASFTFMVPLGVGSAGAVRVGQAVGRRDPSGASRAGWTALVIGTSFMACSALAFVTIPEPILRVFTDDRGVLATGVALLLVAAVFQLFDGVQGVATGILRGLGDTRTAMRWSLAGHWLLGLPLGYTLCFIVGVGVVGLWVGLSTGLILIGVMLLGAWRRGVRALHAERSVAAR
jgi:multidrug resistance protein, MATE family